MKKILLMALVAVVTLASCSKEDKGGSNNEGTKTLKLSINSGSFSRAAEGALANGAKTTITSLYVYFLDKEDLSDASVVVLGSKALDATGIEAAQTAGGFEITGVNSSAKSVYVIANYTENGVTLADPAGTTIANIKAKIATMAADNSTTDWSTALLSNAPTTGNGVIGTVTNNKASVSVSIMPSLSRIEVASLAADQTAGVANEIKVSQFDLKGVYLNGYYPAFTVAGAASGTKQVIDTDPTVAIDPVPAWYKDLYATSLTGKTIYTAADVTGGTVGNIWAYMLPAATPRVIFHIDNIKYGTSAVELGKEQYLTVKTFKYAETTEAGKAGDPVVFTRGCIYKVNSVVFDLSKLHDNPNADNIDVTVTVTVLGWQGIAVNPEF